MIAYLEEFSIFINSSTFYVLRYILLVIFTDIPGALFELLAFLARYYAFTDNEYVKIFLLLCTLNMVSSVQLEVA